MIAAIDPWQETVGAARKPGRWLRPVDRPGTTEKGNAMAIGDTKRVASPPVSRPRPTATCTKSNATCTSRSLAPWILPPSARCAKDELRTEVRRIAEQLSRHRTDLLSQDKKEMLVNEVLDEMFGLGPLEP